MAATKHSKATRLHKEWEFVREDDEGHQFYRERACVPETDATAVSTYRQSRRASGGGVAVSSSRQTRTVKNTWATSVSRKQASLTKAERRIADAVGVSPRAPMPPAGASRRANIGGRRGRTVRAVGQL